jgi:cytoskeletal protein CcmA (bactofilin family)
MTTLDLELTPEPAPPSPAVLVARQRRALVVGLGGGRDADSPAAKSSFAERRLRATDTATSRLVDPLPSTLPDAGAAPPVAPHVARATATRVQLDDALVVPAGALVRGYLRCRSLLLAGDLVGNVHCTGGPVVIRTGASLKGRLVATGDVYVSGTVGDTGGGAVITTRGKLTLAPGARVDGDVRSGRLELHEGAVLQGVAKASED